MVINNICTNGMMNCTDIIGNAVMQITTQTTGNLFVTFLFVIIILLAIAIMLNIRLEYTSIIILPLLLGLMAVSKDFIGVGFLLLAYLAIILTGSFMLK